MSIEILGYRDRRTPDYASTWASRCSSPTSCATSPRTSARPIYLPLEDLARHGVGEDDLLARRDSPGLRLRAATARRARQHFAAARSSLSPVDRKNLFPAEPWGGSTPCC